MKFLITLWTLPQCIVGALAKLFTRAKKADSKPSHFYWELTSGLSLSWFIFVNKDASDLTIYHEYGHRVQSLYLGPLYLFIVGIPSIIWCAIYNKTHKGSYYSFYTEKWADKLGGVDREKQIINGTKEIKWLF